MGTQHLGAPSHTLEAAAAGELAPDVGTSGRDFAPVELSFLQLPFYCHLPPAQVLLEVAKCWTCCFEALRFSGSKRLWLLLTAWCAQHQTKDSGIHCTNNGVKDPASQPMMTSTEILSLGACPFQFSSHYLFFTVLARILVHRISSLQPISSVERGFGTSG